MPTENGKNARVIVGEIPFCWTFYQGADLHDSKAAASGKGLLSINGLVQGRTVLLDSKAFLREEGKVSHEVPSLHVRSFSLLTVALPLVVATATLPARMLLTGKIRPFQAVPDALPLPHHVVFDVPALCALTLGQIRHRLGPPNLNDSEPVPDPARFEETQWSKTYRREGLELRLDYVRKTGKILRCYLTPASGAIPERELDKLLAMGHLMGRPKGLRLTPIFVHQDPTSHRYVNVMVELR